MEGPFDPQHPGQDVGASQPEQDADLHALLERLLGQGDVRPAASGEGGDLWPDLFAAAPAADDVSTIVPAPETPAAIAELAADAEAPAARVELAPARAWEPVVVDSSSTTTNVDDIHAAILASVSVELEPIAPVASVASVEAEPTPVVTFDAFEALVERELEPETILDAAPASEAPTVDAPAFDHAAIEALLSQTAAFDLPPIEWPHEVAAEPIVEAAAEPVVEPAVAAFAQPVAEPVVEAAAEPVVDAIAEPIAAVADEPAVDAVTEALVETAAVEEAPAAFVLTPFDGTDAAVPTETHPDADALWAAAVPELGLDVAPLLDLDTVDDEPAHELEHELVSELVKELAAQPEPAFEPEPEPVDEPVAVTGVVLPWPSQDKAEPAAPSAHDLIEAALSGLHADLTAEPVEPLRTPDVAVSTAHVVFRLGTRTMAIPLAAVSEIARPPKVTRLPHVPAWVLGIANLRGDIVSMLDLEGFFSGKSGKASHEQRMLALRPAGDEVRTAVLVDSVDGIHAFEDARVARVTRGYDAEVAPYARGLYQLEDDLVVVVDADRLLQSKPMRQFEDGAGAR